MKMVEKKFVVTPWEVSGIVDYERLIREFGTQPIGGGLAKRLESSLGDTAYLVRREIFFSHRDLNLVLDDYEKGKGFFLYTGRGPSGPMHIGHILQFYFTKWLQDKFHVNVYIQMTDDEKFLEKKRCLIPSAIDQDPYWRIQRDIAESLGYHKAAAVHSKFMPPLTGMQDKMSSSKPEMAIYLNDDEKTVRNKIYRHAFSGGQSSIEEHRKLGGNPDVDVPFQWLYMFFEPDDKRIEEIRSEYKSGRMFTGQMNDILVEKGTGFLRDHRERREKARTQVHLYKKDGNLAREMWKHDFSKS